MRSSPALAIDAVPGFRRRIRVSPSPGRVCAKLEDDFHHMVVTLRHADGLVVEARGEQIRAPWTTCPGAIEQLARDFNGKSMGDAQRATALKARNCTHLHDLLTLAIAHAHDGAALTYDVLASDPVEGRRLLELRKDGSTTLHWVEQDGRFILPTELDGLDLLTMSDWIRALPERHREAAHVLRWGARVSRGRFTPHERQSNAATMALNCYTFQPHIASHAGRLSNVRDFSTQTAQPLDGKSVASRLEQAR
jgi:hypothetical protein